MHICNPSTQQTGAGHLCEFTAILVYTASSKSARAGSGDPVNDNNSNNNNIKSFLKIRLRLSGEGIQYFGPLHAKAYMYTHTCTHTQTSIHINTHTTHTQSKILGFCLLFLALHFGKHLFCGERGVGWGRISCVEGPCGRL